MGVPNLGHLEGSTERDLRKGTTLELPYWLGISLASVPDRDYLSIALPKPYSQRVRNALAASARSVNLRNLGGAGGWFFSCGVRLEESIEDPRLKEVLSKAFRARLPEVMDQSQHASSSASAATSGIGNVDQAAEAFLAGMDEWEKELYAAGESGSRAMKAWGENRKAKMPTRYGTS